MMTGEPSQPGACLLNGPCLVPRPSPYWRKLRKFGVHIMKIIDHIMAKYTKVGKFLPYQSISSI